MRSMRTVALLMVLAVVFAGCTASDADTGSNGDDGTSGDGGDQVRTVSGSWGNQLSLSKGEAAVYSGGACPQTTVHFKEQTMDRVSIYDGTIDAYDRAKHTTLGAHSDIDVHGYATLNVGTVGDTTADIRLVCDQ